MKRDSTVGLIGQWTGLEKVEDVFLRAVRGNRESRLWHHLELN